MDETDLSQLGVSALELQPGHKYLVTVSEQVGVDALEALVTQLKATAPEAGFLVVDGRVTASQIDKSPILQRGLKAVKKLPGLVLQRAYEGSTDAEEEIVRAVLMAVING